MDRPKTPATNRFIAPEDTDELIRTRALAERLGISMHAARRWMLNNGFVQVGLHWRRADVEEAIAIREMAPKCRVLKPMNIVAPGRKEKSPAITARGVFSMWAHGDGRDSDTERVWVNARFELVTERPLRGKPLLYARRQGDLWVDGAGNPLLRVQPRGIEHGIHIPAVTAVDIAVYRSGMASHHRRQI